MLIAVVALTYLLYSTTARTSLFGSSPASSLPQSDSPSAATTYGKRLSLAPAEVDIVDSGDLAETYSQLADLYLQPWKLEHPAITTRMLDVMELLYDGAAFRIRIIDNELYVRVSKWWPDTYKINRMNWCLQTFTELLAEGGLPDMDAVFSMRDGARVSLDTTLGKDAAFPLFSLIRTAVHIDIPIPDPVAFGSNGNYVWPDAAKTVPWADRKPMALFRGSLSSYQLHADNWHMSPRVRLVRLAQHLPQLIDAGITDWKQAEKRAVLYPICNASEIAASTGITLSSSLSFVEQAHYKYILDIEGGTGSSRKPGILDSGSLMIAQTTPFYRHVDPLLVDGVHYVAVDRHLHTLPHKVQWLQQHDELAHRIKQQGKAFVARHYNKEAIHLYLRTLFTQYSELLADEVTLAPVRFHECRPDVVSGPQGCTMEFTRWNGKPFNTAPFK